MPITIARAVINTGRMRTNPASSAACVALPNSVSFSRAKLITSTLLAVATPMHMIAPVSAGTDSVVCVANSIQTMAGERRRQCGDDDERIAPRLKLITITK